MTSPLLMLAALWAYLSTLAPVDATVIAARVVGLQRYQAEALAIVASESRGVAVGIHGEGDDIRRVRGLTFYRAGIKAGLVRLGECEHHTPGDDGAAGWGIRGAHGNAAAYAVHTLGACIHPAALDVPYLSAVATLYRLRALDRKYGLRTAEARALAWRVGVGAARRQTLVSSHAVARAPVR